MNCPAVVLEVCKFAFLFVFMLFAALSGRFSHIASSSPVEWQGMSFVVANSCGFVLLQCLQIWCSVYLCPVYDDVRGRLHQLSGTSVLGWRAIDNMLELQRARAIRKACADAEATEKSSLMLSRKQHVLHKVGKQYNLLNLPERRRLRVLYPFCVEL